MSPKQQNQTDNEIGCNENSQNHHLSDATFVTEEKVQEAVDVLKKVLENHRQNSSEKKQLFEQDSDYLFLQITLKKIPLNFSTFIHYIPLPHHWRHEIHYETCLIVKDVNKKPLPDRELDLEQTREFYRNLLKENSANELVSDILPMRQLRTEFQLPALRAKLSNEYNVFMCDKKLMNNKYSFLSMFLGKAFWVDHKKVPILIKLDQENLKDQINEKLNQTSLYVSGKGSTLTICVGSLRQETPKLAANLMAVLAKIKQLYANNVRELALKTERSMSIRFYVDLGSANEIRLSKSEENRQNEFVEDEFDFLLNANVRVFKDGRIRVVKRKSKEVAEGEDENEDLEADAGELKFIKTINNLPDDDHWNRRMVFNIPKQLKKQKQHVKNFRHRTVVKNNTPTQQN